MRYTADWYATDSRFDAMASRLDNPARILDFGAINTDTAVKLIARWPGCSAVVVGDEIDSLSSTRITAIPKRLTPSQIGKLGPFDVTLALSVLHHCVQWRNYLNVLRNSAPTLFIETAHPDEDLPNAKAHKHTADMISAVQAIGEPIASTAGYDSRFQRTLWLVQSS